MTNKERRPHQGKGSGHSSQTRNRTPSRKRIYDEPTAYNSQRPPHTDDRYTTAKQTDYERSSQGSSKRMFRSPTVGYEGSPSLTSDRDHSDESRSENDDQDESAEGASTTKKIKLKRRRHKLATDGGALWAGYNRREGKEDLSPSDSMRCMVATEILLARIFSGNVESKWQIHTVWPEGIVAGYNMALTDAWHTAETVQVDTTAAILVQSSVVIPRAAARAMYDAVVDFRCQSTRNIRSIIRSHYTWTSKTQSIKEIAEGLLDQSSFLGTSQDESGRVKGMFMAEILKKCLAAIFVGGPFHLFSKDHCRPYLTPLNQTAIIYISVVINHCIKEYCNGSIPDERSTKLRFEGGGKTLGEWRMMTATWTNMAQERRERIQGLLYQHLYKTLDSFQIMGADDKGYKNEYANTVSDLEELNKILPSGFKVTSRPKSNTPKSSPQAFATDLIPQSSDAVARDPSQRAPAFISKPTPLSETPIGARVETSSNEGASSPPNPTPTLPKRFERQKSHDEDEDDSPIPARSRKKKTTQQQGTDYITLKVQEGGWEVLITLAYGLGWSNAHSIIESSMGDRAREGGYVWFKGLNNRSESILDRKEALLLLEKIARKRGKGKEIKCTYAAIRDKPDSD